MDRLRLLLLVLLAAATAGPLAGSVDAGRFTARGTVARVVDGDTIDVRLRAGGTTRVRLIGIDTPERGACFAARATGRARALALGRAVVLRGDATQATRDRYGRLLAYAWVGGRDLGYRLLAGGFGKAYVYDRPFRRVAAYRRAERAARAAGRGLWSRCARTERASETGSACHPSYSPCLPVVGDLDCGEIPAPKKPIAVRGPDPYGLDGDDDGVGCE